MQSETRLPEPIGTFVERVVDRLQDEPDLDDFLLWHGGTLEGWLQVVATSIGARVGWSSRREVRYFSEYYKGSQRSKLADGAFVFGDRLGVMLETKTVSVARDGTLGSGIDDVPHDLASLAALNWPRTQTWLPQSSEWPWTDRYTDPEWWSKRKSISCLWGLHLVLLHGYGDLQAAKASALRSIEKQYQGVVRRSGDQRTPWLARVEGAVKEAMHEANIIGHEAGGVILTFALPIECPNY